MQTDLGDTVLNHYFLEHAWRTLFKGLHGWADYFNAGFFYPAQNTMAYSDLLLGVMPFYGAVRVLSFNGLLWESDTSFQLWILTILSMNYAVAYAWLRVDFRCSKLASSVGAFLFAFAGPRISQMGHEQLLGQFYSILAIRAGTRAWLNPSRFGFWFFLFTLCIVGQLYAGFYLGWFLVFALTLFVLSALLFSEIRKDFVLKLTTALLRNKQVALQNGVWFFSALFIAYVLLYPMANHYLMAAKLTGFRDYAAAWWMIPAVQSWFYQGPDSWLYGVVLPKIKLFKMISGEHEQRLGYGFFTLAFGILGLIRCAKDKTDSRALTVRILLVSALLLLILATKLPHTVWEPWRLVFDFFPGANAIRAVSRIGLLLSLPLCVGLALYVDRSPFRAWILFAITIACLEQGRTTPSYDKESARSRVRALESEVMKVHQQFGCPYFLYLPRVSDRKYLEEHPWKVAFNANHETKEVRHQLDAMWVQLRTGIPTLNGYSGNNPPGWERIGDIRWVAPVDVHLKTEGARAWMGASGRAFDERCVVTLKI